MKTEHSVFRSVLEQSRKLPGFTRPTRRYWCFISLIATLFGASYLSLLVLVRSWETLLFVLSLSYSLATVLAISAGHQAFHGSLLAHARRSKRLGIAIFIPLGVDGELWRLRHLRDHHPKPNSEGHDADLDNPLFFRLAPYTEHRRYHRYQHLYAPFVYSIGVLVTIFADDFRALVRESSGTSTARRTRMSAAFVARKLLFLGIWFGLPLALNPALSVLPLLAAFALATIPAAWIFLPIAAAHLNEHTSFYNAGEDEEFALLQAETTVDFAGESRFMTMLYGGLNCHLAHHLWPKVSSCHYQKLYSLLRSSNAPAELLPKNISLGRLLHSHFRFLREMGETPTTASR